MKNFFKSLYKFKVIVIGKFMYGLFIDVICDCLDEKKEVKNKIMFLVFDKVWFC